MENYSGQDREEEAYPRGTYVKWAAGVFLFAAVFFVCGFFFARVFPGRDSTLSPLEKTVKAVRSVFYYYDEETEKALMEGALKGMASALDDPYAVYYTAEEYAGQQKSNSGTYVGIGVSISRTGEGTFVLSSVFENSPAARTGLKAGDELLTVNNADTAGLTLDAVTALFRCAEGEENTLLILRSGEELSFTLIAGEVYTPFVHARMLDERIGYIHISGFHGKVAEEVRTAVEDLKRQGMDRLVLDVRDDPGGMLNDVRAVAEVFLPGDTLITSLRGRNGKETSYRTGQAGISLPIAMLVNGRSASASELLAGALRDNGAATLFGTKTFGKGIVQTYYELDKGRQGAFKMTTEAYYTPDGVCIQDEGITPDHIVEMPEDVSYAYIYELTPETDPQLRAAMEYLKQI